MPDWDPIDDWNSIKFQSYPIVSYEQSYTGDMIPGDIAIVSLIGQENLSPGYWINHVGIDPSIMESIR